MGELANYRRIPPPLPDYTCRLQLYPRVRHRRATDYIKTDQRFLIELLFNSDIDLAIFERFIMYSPIRIAEYAESSNDHSRTFMVDSRISDDASQADVWKWSKEELSRIQAAIAIEWPDYQPATVRCLIELFPGGKVAAIPPPLPVKMHGTDSAPAIYRIVQGTADLLNPYLHKCDTDKDFKEALMYCGQALGFEGATQWSNLYRTYEVAADRFGGDAGLVDNLKGCSKSELERFKRTVNHQETIGAFSRHARLNYQPPPNPMSFDTAGRFVLGLMSAWLLFGT